VEVVAALEANTEILPRLDHDLSTQIISSSSFAYNPVEAGPNDVDMTKIWILSCRKLNTDSC
jgi:hypothetical protein